MKTHRFYRLPLRKPIELTDPLFGQIHHGGSITRSNPSRGVHHPLIGKLRHGKEGGGTPAGKIYHGGSITGGPYAGKIYLAPWQYRTVYLRLTT